MSVSLCDTKPARGSALLLVAACLLATPVLAANTPAASEARSDSSLSLRGGQDGTAFRSLLVEGEDRIRIEFERPALELAVDPKLAPGLDWQNTHEILERQAPNAIAPFLRVSALEKSPYTARPWLDSFNSGPVARFRPSVENVSRWRLVIADSRGESVALFEGRGEPKHEIVWDGRTLDGDLATPGLTYSYVFEAFDEAGNKRNFVGEGFEVPTYRHREEDAVVLLFSGEALVDSGERGRSALRSRPQFPVLVEAASHVNQVAQPDQPVRLQVRARSFAEANALAQTVKQGLAPLLMGEPTRIQEVVEVEPDASADGSVTIAVDRSKKL